MLIRLILSTVGFGCRCFFVSRWQTFFPAWSESMLLFFVELCLGMLLALSLSSTWRRTEPPGVSIYSRRSSNFFVPPMANSSAAPWWKIFCSEGNKNWSRSSFYNQSKESRRSFFELRTTKCRAIVSSFALYNSDFGAGNIIPEGCQQLEL